MLKEKDARQQQQQQEEDMEKSHEDSKVKVEEGVPIENSPYVDYGHLDDYKRKAYGAEGHVEPKTGRGAGATDAPTLSGGAVSSEADANATDVINRLGVP